MQCFPELVSDGIFEDLERLPELESYDQVIVAFSGGKDSIACVLHLLEMGLPAEKIELWHHDIDGREGDNRFRMDWPCTPSYCRAFADAFGLKLSFSWREGGFAREFGRNATPTAPTRFEDDKGVIHERGGKGKPGTRLKFPQVSANLSMRWCSAYLKIDVASIALRNQRRFDGSRTLVVTGERAEESVARSRYRRFEVSRDASKTRHVDHWRAVHGWSEREVWAILQRNGVVPPPAYQLGWSRLSCLFCIFGSKHQWASARKLNPSEFVRVANAEASTGLTIQRTGSITELADQGTEYTALHSDSDLVQACLSSGPWTRSVLCDPEEWRLPAGAFGEGAGPT